MSHTYTPTTPFLQRPTTVSPWQLGATLYVPALHPALADSEQKNRSQWVEQLIRSALVPQSEKKTVQLEAKTSSSSSKTPTNESP